MPNSKLGLKRGETISVDDAVLALVTKSANDVAVVIAETLAPTESEFAQMMTKKAKALGMNRTSFRNASGLYNRRQLSTARDMAILAQALIRDFPERYKSFSARSFSHNGRVYRNHNKLLRSYQGADGLKTGYIRAAGYNLAASARRDGHRLIAVLFGGRSAKKRDRQVARLLDRGFSKLTDPIYLADRRHGQAGHSSARHEAAAARFGRSSKTQRGCRRGAPSLTASGFGACRSAPIIPMRPPRKPPSPRPAACRTCCPTPASRSPT